MIPEQDLYAIMAVVMAAVALAFWIAVSRHPTTSSRYFLPVVAVPAVAAVSFGSMAHGILLVERQDGHVVPVARLLMYAVVYPITAGYIGWAAGLRWRGIGALSGGILLVIAGVGVNWLAPAYSGLGSMLVVVSLLAIAYLLLGPYNRRSRARPGELRLLFVKLRDLLLLLWALYVCLSLVTRQGFGLLDTFSGVFLGNYFDFLAIVGFGLILLRSPEAMTMLVEEADSTVASTSTVESEE